MKTYPTNSKPVNNRGVEFIAEFESKAGRGTKPNDILIFDRIDITTRIDTTNRIDGKKNFKKGAFFKAASDSLFRKFFGYRAKSKDVEDIFKSAGMDKDETARALQHVKLKSEKLGLSGLSAQAVEEQLQLLKKPN